MNVRIIQLVIGWLYVSYYQKKSLFHFDKFLCFLKIFISCLTSTFSLASLIPNLQSFAEASGSGGYVYQIIDRKSKIDIFDEQGEVPSKFTGDIEFKNVHFTYPSRQEAPVREEFS